MRRATSRGATPALAIALLTTAAACGGGGADAGGGTPYTPPAATAGADGWESYADAPMVDEAAARGLDPVPDSPEAAVVKFLASRVRGDGAWEGAMVSSPSDRARRALDEWDEWNLAQFQLRGKKATGTDSYYVKTFFEISVDGDTDEGEDEFEVVREDGGWRVASPPT